ncbi:MAG: carboxypeptidase regulatory-like domain-containing protein [Thermoguttaceae bacterium]
MIGYATCLKKTFTIQLLDPSNQPIPNGKIKVFVNPKPKNWLKSNFDVYTNEQGEYTVRFAEPTEIREFVWSVRARGYAPYWANWENTTTDQLPERFTLTLEKARTIGGKVVDVDGKPLSGVNVQGSCDWNHRIREKKQAFGNGIYCETDEKGIWTYENLADDVFEDVSQFTFKHPDFKQQTVQCAFQTLSPNESGEFTQTVMLDKGIDIIGNVTDTEGNPVVDVLVYGSWNNWNGYGKARTDTEGNYKIANWSETKNAYLGVWKPGYQAQLVSPLVVKADGMSPVNFTLKPVGKPITIKIVDKDNEPIEGYSIAIEAWGHRRLPGSSFLNGTDDYAKTDSNGQWIWREAPENEPITFDMFGDRKYMDTRQKVMQSRDEEYVCTVNPSLAISGEVTDAQTGEKIEDFKVTLGIGFPERPASWQDSITTKGKYFITESMNTYDYYQIKVEAKGYKPGLSRKIDPQEGAITVNLALEKWDDSHDKAVSGSVILPDGQPGAKAKLGISTWNYNPYIQNGKFPHEREPYHTTADENGVFTFPYIDFAAEKSAFPSEDQPVDFRGKRKSEPLPDYIIYILHPEGYKIVTQKEMETVYAKEPIKLDAWGTIKGTVKIQTQPGKNLDLSYVQKREGNSGRGPRNAYFDLKTTSDSDGQFTFSKIPSGQGQVFRLVQFADQGNGFSSACSHAEPVSIQSGESSIVHLGGTGRPVSGQLKTSSDFPSPVNWNYAIIRVKPVERPQELLESPEYMAFREMSAQLIDALPENLKDPNMDPEERVKELIEWTENTEEGKKYQELLDKMEVAQEAFQKLQQQQAEVVIPYRCSAVDENGKFTISDVFVGDWELEVELFSPPSPNTCGTGDRIGQLTYNFTMPEIPEGVSEEPLVLGELVVEKKPEFFQLQPGMDAPDFEIRKLVPFKESEVQEGETATEKPETDMEAESPDMIKLSDFKGKYVVLDFWATWCGPCVAKLPELKSFYEKHAGNENVVLVGISLDNPSQMKMVEKFLAKKDINWPNGIEGSGTTTVAQSYGVNVIPTLFVIGPDGKVLRVNPTLEQIGRAIEKVTK